MSIFKADIRRIFALCILVLTGIFTVSAQTADNEHTTSKKILCINSYGESALYVKKELSSFVNNPEGIKVMPVVEAMDCRSLNDIQEWQTTMQHILNKHPQTDAIILLGNEAAITYFSMPDEKYRQIPLYILQCNTLLASLPTKNGITAVAPPGNIKLIREIFNSYNVRYAELTEYSATRNLELIQRLYGNVNDIAVLTDNTYTGLCMQRVVKEIAPRFNQWKFHYIDGQKYSMQQALERIKALPSHTAILLGCWKVDKNNDIYLNNAINAFKDIRQQLLTPTFTLSGQAMGYWPIGGYIPRIKEENVGLAEIIRTDFASNMSGTTPRIRVLPLDYIFDAKVMHNMEITKEEMPERALYINDGLTYTEVLEEYKKEIIALVIFIVLLVVGVIASTGFSIRMKKLQKKLKQSQDELLEEKEMLEKSQQQLFEAKERAEKAVTAKSIFISNISHEIRTPLNSISGFSQVLSDMVKDQPEVYEFADIIHNNVDTLSKLIDSLLKISDIQTGKVNFEMSKIDIISFIKGIIEDIKKDLPETIKLKLTSPYQTLDVRADMQHLIDILMKLLQNAIKYTQEGNVSLNVNVDPTHTMATISVTDTGCGISKEIRRVLFDRFDKMEEFIQGSGMSLTVCQSIIEAMGGKIWLDENYTNGASFIFTLPLYKES